MFCRKCGKEMDDGWKFCRHCGEQIVDWSEETQTDQTDETPSYTTDSGTNSTSKFKKVGMSILSLVGVLCIIGYFTERGGIEPSMEKQTEELLKDCIREKILDKNKFSPYVALDRLEDYKLERKQVADSRQRKTRVALNHSKNRPFYFNKYEKNSESVCEYEGTAKVVYRAKYGPARTEMFVYAVMVRKSGRQIELECKPKDEERFAKKFGELLESAGYEEDDED